MFRSRDVGAKAASLLIVQPGNTELSLSPGKYILELSLIAILHLHINSNCYFTLSQLLDSVLEKFECSFGSKVIFCIVMTGVLCKGFLWPISSLISI